MSWFVAIPILKWVKAENLQAYVDDSTYGSFQPGFRSGYWTKAVLVALVHSFYLQMEEGMGKR